MRVQVTLGDANTGRSLCTTNPKRSVKGAVILQYAMNFAPSHVEYPVQGMK